MAEKKRSEKCSAPLSQKKKREKKSSVESGHTPSSRFRLDICPPTYMSFSEEKCSRNWTDTVGGTYMLLELSKTGLPIFQAVRCAYGNSETPINGHASHMSILKILRVRKS